MRKIIAYKNYYIEFMKKLSEQERGKIRRALLLFETEDKIPRHYKGMGCMSFVSPMATKSFDYFSSLMEIQL